MSSSLSVSQSSQQGRVLTPEEMKSLTAELNALKKEIMGDLGEHDKTYFMRVYYATKTLDVLSKTGLIIGGKYPAVLPLSVAGLALARVVDNMEIGHNVLHGQWDWLKHPKINSKNWEWSFTTPSKAWKKTHNAHHAWTNVIGRDDDIGYNDFVRVTGKQSWVPKHALNLVNTTLLALVFDLGIASYDTEYKHYFAGEKSREEFMKDLRVTLRKLGKMVIKDHVLIGACSYLLGGRKAAVYSVSGLMAALTLRNVWAHSVIFCGHFPEGTTYYSEEEVKGESKGQWYLRQMAGSANFTGFKGIDFLSGHLSKQIEHHLFPNMPSNRLPYAAKQVKKICVKYGLPYNEAPMHQQLLSTWKQLLTHSHR